MYFIEHFLSRVGAYNGAVTGTSTPAARSRHPPAAARHQGIVTG
jgi:hypothetical protein